MKAFNKIANIAAVKKDVATVKRNTTSTVKILNARLPEMIEGVIAGDNVAIINSLLRPGVLTPSNRKEVTRFVKAFLPHELVKDTQLFGKKLKNEKVREEKLEAFNDFIESGQTVFEWLAQSKVQDDKPVDWAAKVKRTLSHAIKDGGLSATDILLILSDLSDDVEKPADNAPMAKAA